MKRISHNVCLPLIGCLLLFFGVWEVKGVGSVPEQTQTRNANTDPPTYWQSRSDHRITYPIAIKTNLLFDVVGAPNIGIEIPLGCRFSVMADFAYAHWRIKNRFAMQTLQGSVEAKYWFNPGLRPLTGWSLGIYGTYSDRFDIQWNGGWQGDGFVSAGLIAGYSFPISRSFNLEFAVGGGAFYTPEARKYGKPVDGHLIWEETRQNVWRILPTKLKINLIWLIQSKKRITVR